jgi:hypothetical protein
VNAALLWVEPSVIASTSDASKDHPASVAVLARPGAAQAGDAGGIQAGLGFGQNWPYWCVG